MVTGYTGTVHFTSNDSTAILPSDATLTNGAGTFSAVLNTAGSRTITVSDKVFSAITGRSNPVTVNPAAATRLFVSAPGSTLTGSSFSITVTALDPYGNTATGFAGTVNFTSSDTNSTLPADSALNAGTGTFPIILRTVGSWTITGTDLVTPSVTGSSDVVQVTVTVPPSVYPVSSVINGGGDDSALSPTATPALSGTTNVNVGGNSAVTHVVVTGTGITGLIVTGGVASGPGLNTANPPGIVYQYLDITPARYGTITGAEISFVVPQSWLTEHHFTAQDMVMYHRVGTVWQALPTRLVKSANGQLWFTATSPGLSRFAITGQAHATVTTVSTQAEKVGNGVKSSVVEKSVYTASPVSSGPVVTQKIAPTAPATPDPGFPFTAAALIGVCGIGLIGGGMLVRRWWIRRQNPALFREYD
jgi:hypothetical protein